MSNHHIGSATKGRAINIRLGVTRLYGLASAAYGAYALYKPEHIAEAAGVSEESAESLGRIFAARDIPSGAAIAFAPRGKWLVTALLARATFDTIDAVGFGTALDDRSKGLRIAVIALSWGAIAVALALQERASS